MVSFVMYERERETECERDRGEKEIETPTSSILFGETRGINK